MRRKVKMPSSPKPSNWRRVSLLAETEACTRLFSDIKFLFQTSKYEGRDFPGGPVVKDPPANAGHTGSSPGPRRSHMPQSN